MREKLPDVLLHGVIFSMFAGIITVYFRERNDYNYKCRHKNDKERNRMKNYLKFVSAILIAQSFPPARPEAALIIPQQAQITPETR